MIKQIEINEADAFKNCKLQRHELAISLTKLISGFTEGGVIALNNSWGSGKTTFIKMWEGLLKEENFTTINFNAWENDFEDSPLVALIAELKNKFNTNGESTFKEILKHGGKITLDIGQVLAKNIVKKYIGNQTISDIIDAVNKSSNEIFAKEIDNYLERKNSIEEFKKSLSSFVTENSEKLPIIFFIDELDRCRPSYAVKLLECVKHIFSVPNVVFILSIDKTQLCHSINGFYGSEKFDSSDYLRRFIDLEYSLPKVTNREYFINLLDRLDFKELMLEKYDSIYTSKFLKSCEAYFKNLSLRQIEKIFLHLSINIKTFDIQFSSLNILIYLLYIKNFHSDFYHKIRNYKVDLNEFMNLFQNIYITDFKSNSYLNKNDITLLQAQIVYSYNNYARSFQIFPESLFIQNNESGSTEINSKLLSEINQESFYKNLVDIDKGHTDVAPDDLKDIFNWIEFMN
ncbi:KAP family P-loop NTPase fold protein [Sphingobacterium sp. MYb388]|uniref:KAP family P-loop NTPase fold protein n=1 Tax=Sphingobacterium sp. MYb388 TaxID=2745437 RepID=UPI0030A6CCFD